LVLSKRKERTQPQVKPMIKKEIKQTAIKTAIAMPQIAPTDKPENNFTIKPLTMKPILKTPIEVKGPLDFTEGTGRLGGLILNGGWMIPEVGVLGKVNQSQGYDAYVRMHFRSMP
jgi:hypothetical protein